MTIRREVRICPCKACTAPFEPWSPSMATEVIRRDLWRAETRRFIASPTLIRELRAAARIVFEDEPDYVHWFFDNGCGPAPTPWRGEGAFVG